MKRIWLVRHAESRAQTGDMLGIDTPLSTLGILQAEQLKIPLGKIKFDCAFISPLKRARQTYECSGLQCENIRFDSRLLEEMPPNAYKSLLPYEDLPVYGSPDTKNAWTIDISSRVKSFLDELKNSDNGNKILVIAHSGLLSILFQSLLTGTKENDINNDLYLGMNNCGISSFTFDPAKTPKYTLLFWNDISHVRKQLGYDPML